MKTCSQVVELTVLFGVFCILSFQLGSDAKLSCKKNAKSLQLPPHTKLARRQKAVKGLKIVCDKGYVFPNGKTRLVLRCKKGVISHPVPACRGCDPPTDINNGTRSFSKTTVGSKATYSCQTGFTLVGRRQRRCGRNLKWSGRVKPFCRPNKCVPPSRILNGNITTTDPTYSELATLSFECNDGYELRGEQDIICRENRWSSRFPYCWEKRCPRPGKPENGRLFGNDFRIGSTVEFFCNSGFKLYGSSKRTCQKDKIWNGTLTTCDDGRFHCYNPGVPVGAIKVGERYNIGDVVKYRCNSGYKLLGSSNRTCTANKTWSGNQPKCVDKNYREFPSINETAQRLQEGFIGSLLQVTCSGTNVSCSNDSRGRSIHHKNKHGLDLIFVLDSSSSIKEANFEIAKKFITRMVDIFGVDYDRPDGTQIACVTYGTTATLQFTLGAASVETKKKALRKIRKIKYSRGGTATKAALEMVRDVILHAKSVRKHSVKALFLITDGKSNIGGAPNRVARELENKMKVEIYVIGIGTGVTHESLRELATEGSSNVFTVEKYQDLKTILEQIVIPADYSRCGHPYYMPPQPYGRKRRYVDSRARIVGGSRSIDGDWPWAVQILKEEKFECGGAILNEEWILTAAHCFSDNPMYVSVHIQFIDLDKITLRTITKYIKHPNYNPFTYENDIALIRFEKLPRRYNRYRQRVCLPRGLDVSKIKQVGARLYAVGWGGTVAVKPGEQAKKDHYAEKLRQVDIPFRDDKDCYWTVRKKPKGIQQNWVFDNTTQFCAGHNFGGRDTCHGDSGGPAMVLHEDPVDRKPKWFQVGIVSYGDGCAQKGEYGFYTKVTAYLDWIDDEMKKSEK